ncbi:MAG: hypothetical protein KGJ55_09215 [Gammaproteobacteria bacterium]|nr:hypothetical protein [Gammaproteobacteria bacterium]
MTKPVTTNMTIRSGGLLAALILHGAIFLGFGALHTRPQRHPRVEAGMPVLVAMVRRPLREVARLAGIADLLLRPCAKLSGGR